MKYGGQRLSPHGWRIMHRALMTNANRFDRTCGVSDVCPRCHSESEDEYHLVWGRQAAKKVWESIITPSEWPKLIQAADSSDNWLERMLKELVYKKIKVHYFECMSIPTTSVDDIPTVQVRENVKMGKT